MTSTSEVPDPLRVVIIDDTADLRDLMRIALTRGGMQVIGEAADGAAGIEVVRECHPDVVLLDLSMPVMDGLEALPIIRQIVPDARILVLSGFGASQMSDRALEIGADGYVQKGASLGRILDRIRDVTDAQPRRTLGSVPTAATGHEVRLVASPPSDAMELAPYGILLVSAEPPYRVLSMNTAALELFEVAPTPGAPLQDSAPNLAVTIAANRLRGDLGFETQLGNQATQVTLRHSGDTLLLYLQPTQGEVAMLRSAIATTAHEIRGPVSVLCAVAETLSESTEMTAEERERMLASVVRQAQMLDGITADLMTASAIQRGTLRIDCRVVDPYEVIYAIVEDRFAGTVSVAVSDGRSIVADPLRLEQMLGNLLSNAHKYGRPPVVIRVHPSPERPDFVAIDVCDNGYGVPVEFRPQLFREFSRASATAAAGTGLGLHVVRTLAEAQGGSVAYAPGAGAGGDVGEGATFSIMLPAAAPRGVTSLRSEHRGAHGDASR